MNNELQTLLDELKKEYQRSSELLDKEAELLEKIIKVLQTNL